MENFIFCAVNVLSEDTTLSSLVTVGLVKREIFVMWRHIGHVIKESYNFKSTGLSC